MTDGRRGALALGVVCWFGFLAFFGQLLAERRPAPPWFRAGVELIVTSSADAGVGSLREAILAADRAPERARIRILAARITLETALPPLVNPAGVVIDARTEIDARGLHEEPALNIVARQSAVRGLTIRGTAVGPGILVRAEGVRLAQVALRDCAVGLEVAEGADGLIVEGSSFEENGIGIRVAAQPSGVSVTDNRFRKHDQAAVWAVSPSPPLGTATPRIVLRRNRFEDDRISVVLINVPGQVEDNRFARPTEAAVYITGPGMVRRNRLQGSARFGVLANAADGAHIEGNELDHNVGVGILLREGRAVSVERNNVYENGYGIVVVFGDRGRPVVVSENLVMSHRHDGLFVVGGSPVLRSNRVTGNRGAGLRVLDYVPLRGPRLAADPLLQANVLQDNASNGPLRGEYHAPRTTP